MFLLMSGNKADDGGTFLSFLFEYRGLGDIGGNDMAARVLGPRPNWWGHHRLARTFPFDPSKAIARQTPEHLCSVMPAHRRDISFEFSGAAAMLAGGRWNFRHTHCYRG